MPYIDGNTQKIIIKYINNHSFNEQYSLCNYYLRRYSYSGGLIIDRDEWLPITLESYSEPCLR